MSSGNFQKAFLNNLTIFITLKENKILLHHSSSNAYEGCGKDEQKQHNSNGTMKREYR